MQDKDIINAVISYFFLGPIIWLARGNPNFSHPFVQEHAKRASFIFGLGLIGWMIFIYLIKPISRYQIGPVMLADIILLLGVIVLLSALLYHAYRAYQGESAHSIHIEKLNSVTETSEKTQDQLSEQEKILIFLSFIPYVGIWIGAKFPSEETRYAEALGTWTMIIILLISIIFDAGYSVGLILTLTYIIYTITVGVYLFAENKWIEVRVFRFLPTLSRVNLFLLSLVKYLKEILYLLIGKKNTLSWSEIYQNTNYDVFSSRNNYMMSPIVIAIPLLNIITLPSYFIGEYRSWRLVLLEGYILTIGFLLIGYFLGTTSLYLYLLLFPTIFLASHIGSTYNHSTPVVALLAKSLNYLTFGILAGKEKIQVLSSNTQAIRFTYDENNDTKKTNHL